MDLSPFFLHINMKNGYEIKRITNFFCILREGSKNREKVVTSYMDGPVRRSNHIETYVHHLSAIEGAKWKLIFIAFFSHCGTYSSLVEGFFDPPSEIMEWK